MKLFVTIVLDGVGIGAAPDAGIYGDVSSDTLGHVCSSANPHLPNLAALGLGNIRHLAGVSPVEKPGASFGRMRPISAGKDSTTGHWELAGIVLNTPFPTYPDGFPPDVVENFLSQTGASGVLGNRPESGTKIIDELGVEHIKTGQPIIYTSADSVFQIAAHVDIISLEKLYKFCELTRTNVCTGKNAVGRVIARPFRGREGAFNRISEARKDFSLQPPSPSLLDMLQDRDVKTVSVGKIIDLFAGGGFSESRKTRTNSEGIETLIRRIGQSVDEGGETFIWVNLIDFDQEYGHRNDPEGFSRSLEEFDRALPAIEAALPVGSRLLITADHGNDPTTSSTDHSREFVPLLYYGSNMQCDLSIRSSFCDHAATVAAFFDVPFDAGDSGSESIDAVSLEHF